MRRACAAWTPAGRNVQRAATTIVALLASPGAADAVGKALVGPAAPGRVRVAAVDRRLAALDRAAAAQAQLSGAGSTIGVHDADPLAAVSAAWARLFDGEGAAGELEIAVGAALGRWRARQVELPDFYLVVDPEAWDVTRRHFYLGVLAAAAPSRVVPVRTVEEVPAALRRLPAGRWWPELPRLLEGLDRQVPDRLATDRPGSGAAEDAGAAEAPGLITPLPARRL